MQAMSCGALYAEGALTSDLESTWAWTLKLQGALPWRHSGKLFGAESQRALCLCHLVGGTGAIVSTNMWCPSVYHIEITLIEGLGWCDVGR